MTTFIDIHVLQTLPPSNPNRDEYGAPKTAVFGGVNRQRISSQAIKRATREDFETKIDPTKVGYRTKKLVELLASKLLEISSELEEDKALELATLALKEAGFNLKPSRAKGTKENAPEEAGFLVFISSAQITHIAEAIIQASQEDDFKKAFKALKPKELLNSDNSIDIALFGRMVAEPNGINVDASCQVAHAISVNEIMREFDYFTAVDDIKSSDSEEDAGAGMLGTIEFASSTMYRYATINFDMLTENLGSIDAAYEAVRVFVDAFTRAMPSGKVTTFANRTLPDAVYVAIRDDQPINYAAAFERAVVANAEGYLQPAVDRLVDFNKEMIEGSGLKPRATLVAWTRQEAHNVAELGERVTIADLGARTAQALEEL